MKKKLNTDETDHSHTCACCGFTYQCRFYNLKHCQTRGVLKAAAINRQGPFCDVCRHLIMATRTAQARGWGLFWEIGKPDGNAITSTDAPVI